LGLSRRVVVVVAATGIAWSLGGCDTGSSGSETGNVRADAGARVPVGRPIEGSGEATLPMLDGTVATIVGRSLSGSAEIGGAPLYWEEERQEQWDERGRATWDLTVVGRSFLETRGESLAIVGDAADGTSYLFLTGWQSNLAGNQYEGEAIHGFWAYVPFVDYAPGKTVEIDGIERGVVFAVFAESVEEPTIAAVATGGTLTFGSGELLPGSKLSVTVTGELAAIEWPSAVADPGGGHDCKPPEDPTDLWMDLDDAPHRLASDIMTIVFAIDSELPKGDWGEWHQSVALSEDASVDVDCSYSERLGGQECTIGSLLPPPATLTLLRMPAGREESRCLAEWWVPIDWWLSSRTHYVEQRGSFSYDDTSPIESIAGEIENAVVFDDLNLLASCTFEGAAAEESSVEITGCTVVCDEDPPDPQQQGSLNCGEINEFSLVLAVNSVCIIQSLVATLSSSSLGDLEGSIAEDNACVSVGVDYYCSYSERDQGQQCAAYLQFPRPDSFSPDLSLLRIPVGDGVFDYHAGWTVYPDQQCADGYLFGFQDGWMSMSSDAESGLWTGEIRNQIVDQGGAGSELWMECGFSVEQGDLDGFAMDECSAR
ncbi:MAG: hypothetical protein V2A73_00690, partial [Pseudomonadota bacterium]